MNGGIVVSNDAYNDLLGDPAMADTIHYHKLPFTFVRDTLMFPEDPLGKGGPSLARFLSF